MGNLARQSAYAADERNQWLTWGQQVIQTEAAALNQLMDSLGSDFLDAVEAIRYTRGHVVLCGMGKAGLIASKLSATFSSTGTPSHFLHPAEAIHGDLGKVRVGDMAIVLSQSGETEEVTRLLPSLKQQCDGLISITGNVTSTLARSSDIILALPILREACVNGLAPSTSTTAMLALGDALALVVSQTRGFTSKDFARFHPGGSLGRKLRCVDEIMRPIDECRIANSDQSVRAVLVQAAKKGRRDENAQSL